MKHLSLEINWTELQCSLVECATGLDEYDEDFITLYTESALFSWITGQQKWTSQ